MSYKNDLIRSFIGKNIKIVKATNHLLVGVEGRILDETKNTFCLMTTKGKKKVVKNQIEFIIGDKLIKGHQIMKSPEDRIKLRNKND